VNHLSGQQGKFYTVPSHALLSRLDATYYDPLKNLVLSLLQDGAESGRFRIETIGNIAKRIFFPGRFKRVYVSSDNGIPFLSGADIVQFDLTNIKYLSRRSSNLPELLVKKDWVLVTRSGTVGIAIKVPEYMDGFAVSEHVIRIVPDENKVDAGYLYAVLSSELGSSLLKPGVHGSVVDEISPEYIAQQRIPVPDRIAQKKIGDLVRKADRHLTEALRLHLLARNEIFNLLGLSRERIRLGLKPHLLTE